MVFEDDTIWSWPSEGQYESTESTEAWVSCDPEDLKDVEKAQERGEHVYTPGPVDLGGPKLKARRRMGPAKRVAAA